MCTATMDSPPPCSNDPHEDILSKIDTRKSNKPLMEKKRRQRINRCLNDLKSLVLEGMKKDPSRYSKLEKADILEMTVRHVQALHRHEGASCRLGGGGGRLLGGGRPAGGDSRTKYRAGFIHCAVEVTRYLAGLTGVPHDLHHRLITHLNTVTASLTCVPGVGQLPGASVAVGGGVVTVAPPPATRTDASSAPSTAPSASSPVMSNPGAPISPINVSCRTPPPVLLPGSAGTPIFTTNLSTTAVSFVPARLAPQHTIQVLPSSSSASSASLTQAAHPQQLTFPPPLTADKVHSSTTLGLHKSGRMSAAQGSLSSQNITLVVRGDNSSSQEAVGSFVSSNTYPSRVPPFTSSTLTPPGEIMPTSRRPPHYKQDESIFPSVRTGTSVIQGHSATSVDVPPLSDPKTLYSDSQDKANPTSWAPPLGFQVSVKFSNASSPPVLSSPSIWSSPVLVRPTPTMPAALPHPPSTSLLPSSSPSFSISSYSLSSSTSSYSFSSSSSSSPSPSSSSSSPIASVLTAPAFPQATASLPPSPNKEPLNLAMNHGQQPPVSAAPRAHLKLLPSALPRSRPSPYPLPRPLSPLPSQPWRPW